MFNLQGLVLFVLYVAGIAGAMAVAFVMQRAAGRRAQHPLMMELPSYRWPTPRNLAIGLWERARIFLERVGTIILALMIVLWFLSSFPAPPAGATGPAIQYSFAGMLGHALEHVFAPIGFNWQISIALVPGLAAREVAVAALGTVYALSSVDREVAAQLLPMIASGWSLATAFSLLAWYVFAPQCISTLAIMRRETNSWRYPLMMAGYLFALAYVAAFVTYRVTLLFHRERAEGTDAGSRRLRDRRARRRLRGVEADAARFARAPRAGDRRLGAAPRAALRPARRRPRAAPHCGRMRQLRQLRHLWPRAGLCCATGRSRTALHAAEMSGGPLRSGSKLA